MKYSKLEVGIIIDNPIFYDGVNYWAKESFYNLLGQLAIYFDNIYVFASVVNNKTDVEKYKLEIPYNVKIIKIGSHRNIRYLYYTYYRYFFQSVIKLIKSRNKFKVLVFIDPERPHFFPLYLICRLYKIRTVLYVRASLKSYDIKYQINILKVFSTFYSLATNYLLKSQLKRSYGIFVGEQLYSQYGQLCSKSYCFYFNVLSKEVKPTPFRNFSFDNNLRLLTVSRIVAQKGLEFMFSAIRDLIIKKNINVSYYLVGDGRHLSILKAQAKKYKLEKYIYFEGYVPWGEQLFWYYRNCDIFVLPSLIEGFPKTIFEAMWFKMPVICTNVGSIPKIVSHNKNGYIIEPRSSEEIFNAIYNMYLDRKLLNGIVDIGHRTAREFTFEAQTEKLANFLIDCIQIQER